MKDDYCFDAIKQMGYQVCIPYCDVNLFFRCLREAWYRLHLPCKKLWFNRKLNHIDADIFILSDPLMTPELINFIEQRYPKKRVILSYENRVEKTINPNTITKSRVEKWSYDKDDCEKYHMRYVGSSYFDIYRRKKKQMLKYDIVYLGRDKGRAEKLFNLEKKFNDIGLKTYFYICADRKFLKYKKTFYKPLMPYKTYLELISRTRAILNIMPEGQTSVTTRDFEAIFHGVKEITNNKGIKQYDFYDPSRFFILGEDKLEELPKFLKSKFVPISPRELDKYRYQNWLNQIIQQ